MLAVTTEQKNHLKHINIIRVLVFLGILVVSVSLLVLMNNLFIALLLAFVISYLTRPLILPLERAGFSYNQSLIIIFITGLGLLSLLGIWLFPLALEQVAHLQTEWPRYFEGIAALIETTEMKIKNWLSIDIELRKVGEARLAALGKLIVKGLPARVMQLATILLLAPFLAFFMLKDGHRLSKSFMVLVPNNLFEMVLDLQYQINKQLGLFIRARFTEAFIVGLVTFAGLSIIACPFPLLLASFAAATNLIPYLGPIIGAAPAIIVALVNHFTPLDLFFLVLVYIVAQSIDTGILIPLLVARIVNLHPVTVVLLIILGGQFMGILGMIISIPLANALKVTFVAVYQHLTQSKQLNL